jgi:hypothetical protein
MSNEMHELTMLELETVSGGEGTESPDADRKAAILSQFVKFGAMIGALGGAGHKPA